MFVVHVVKYLTDSCVAWEMAAQPFFTSADNWREQMARVLPSLTDLSNMRDRLLWESDVSLASLTHWFPFAFNCFISNSTTIWWLGWEFFLFCLLHCFLFFRVNGAHISSVRTLDLCNYCPGLVYPTTPPLYHHLSDWSRRGDHQCNRSLLIKVWTRNIESNLYTVESSSCFNKRTWVAYLRWWQAHGSFCCRSLQVALTRPQVEGFLCAWPENPAWN